MISGLNHVGVKVILGEFKLKDKKCRSCHCLYKTYEEKQTDVNISIKLFQEAIYDNYDTAMIISGDSDLMPALKAVKQTFPSKQIGVIIPIGRCAESLKKLLIFI